AALSRAMPDKRLLQWMQGLRIPQPFHRQHVLPAGFERQIAARARGLAAHEDGACPAHFRFAPALGSRQSEPIPEQVEQRLFDRDSSRPRLTVDDGSDCNEVY